AAATRTAMAKKKARRRDGRLPDVLSSPSAASIPAGASAFGRLMAWSMISSLGSRRTPCVCHDPGPFVTRNRGKGPRLQVKFTPCWPRWHGSAGGESMTKRPYAVYDVFTQNPFAGNPLAVVFDGDGL